MLFPSLAISILLHAPLPAADLASTEWALRRSPGLYELNPLGPSRPARVALALAAAGGSTWLDTKLKGPPRTLFRIGHFLLTAYVVRHNLGVGRGH